MNDNISKIEETDEIWNGLGGKVMEYIFMDSASSFAILGYID
jgi:hypothetical protein